MKAHYTTIVLSWNYWGLGHLSTVSSFREMVWSHKSNIVFLYEKPYHENKIEEIQKVLKFEACFSLDRVGCIGGQALL